MCGSRKSKKNFEMCFVSIKITLCSKICQRWWSSGYATKSVLSQLTFTCVKLTIETVEKDVKCVQS